MDVFSWQAGLKPTNVMNPQTSPGLSQEGAEALATLMQESIKTGLVKNAELHTTGFNSSANLQLTLTVEGIIRLLLEPQRKLKEAQDQSLDLDFLNDQITEYGESLTKLPKGFLEGLKAAEGILRGTDYLENYIND